MSLAVVLAALLLAAPVETLTPERVIALARKAPALQEYGGLRVNKMMAIPETGERAWFVEVKWGADGSALLVVARTDSWPGGEAPDTGAWFGRDGEWGIPELAVGKTWDDLVADLEKARDASFESAVIGDLRVLVSAEMTFAAFGGGAYAELACLVEPAPCLKDGPAEALLWPKAAEPERAGYRRTFHPGPAVPPGGPLLKPALSAFAMTVVPVEPKPGKRSFCVDASGTICARADGKPPVVKAGACVPEDCAPLQ